MIRGEPRWDTSADCRHCALRQQALFAAPRAPDFEHISPSIRASLVPAGTVPAGTEIYREDTAAEAVHTIRRGIVKLIKQTPGQEARIIVRLLGRGLFPPPLQWPIHHQFHNLPSDGTADADHPINLFARNLI